MQCAELEELRSARDALDERVLALDVGHGCEKRRLRKEIAALRDELALAPAAAPPAPLAAEREPRRGQAPRAASDGV